MQTKVERKSSKIEDKESDVGDLQAARVFVINRSLKLESSEQLMFFHRQQNGSVSHVAGIRTNSPINGCLAGHIYYTLPRISMIGSSARPRLCWHTVGDANSVTAVQGTV